jgi:FkbM family methyltransferase
MKYVLIDGGFRDGVYTEHYLKTHDPCCVYAFEPFQFNMERAAAIAIAYPKSAIVPNDKALWVTEGTLDFYPATRIDGGSLIDGMKHKASVEPVKISCVDTATILEDARKIYPEASFHIKLDIEGAEYAVINHLLDRKAIRPADELVVEWHTRQNRGLREAHDLLIARLELNDITYVNWK